MTQKTHNIPISQYQYTTSSDLINQTTRRHQLRQDVMDWVTPSIRIPDPSALSFPDWDSVSIEWATLDPANQGSGTGGGPINILAHPTLPPRVTGPSLIQGTFSEDRQQLEMHAWNTEQKIFSKTYLRIKRRKIIRNATFKQFAVSVNSFVSGFYNFQNEGVSTLPEDLEFQFLCGVNIFFTNNTNVFGPTVTAKDISTNRVLGSFKSDPKLNGLFTNPSLQVTYEESQKRGTQLIPPPGKIETFKQKLNASSHRFEFTSSQDITIEEVVTVELRVRGEWQWVKVNHNYDSQLVLL